MIVWLAASPGLDIDHVAAIVSRAFATNCYSLSDGEYDGKLKNLIVKPPGSAERQILQDFAAASEELFFVYTDQPPEPGTKVIYFSCDPRDTLVQKDFSKVPNYGMPGNPSNVLEIHYICEWMDHTSAWDPANRPNTLLLKYTDLTANAGLTLEKLTNFLDVKLSDEASNLSEFFDSDESSNASTYNFDANMESLVQAVNVVSADALIELGYEVFTQGLDDDALRTIAMVSQYNWTSTLQRTTRMRALELRSFQLAEEKKAQAREIQSRVEEALKLENRLSDLEQFAASLASEKNEREHHVRSLSNDLEALRDQLNDLNKRNKTLASTNAHIEKNLNEMSDVLSPRLSTLLTLKPLRFVVNRRRQIKRNLIAVDGRGVPLPHFENELESPDLTGPLSIESPLPKREIRPRASIYDLHSSDKTLGIAVFTFDRAENAESVLESLFLQNGLENTHVWIDGDQGNPDKRARLDKTEARVSRFPVKQIHRNRGNYGFRKMMIVAMRKMFEQYDRVLFLEDDCFPTRHAVQGFNHELDLIESDPEMFSVYGHPFLTEQEREGPIGRFQGWGWASTRDKLMPLWKELLETYLMSEDEYRAFIEQGLTEDILSKIDVTPGRQPSSTLPKFFAWDETLGYLAAKRNLKHKASDERLIYNFGVGASSTHFNKIEHYRAPPFNMVTIDELWDHF